MTNSPADVVRWLLVSLGVGTDPSDGGAWPVFTSGEPATPDNCITVFDSVGYADGRGMIDGEIYRHEGFQIRVRSVDHPTGWAKIDAIREGLSQDVYRETVVIGSSSYLVHCVARFGDIITLGKEVPTSKRNLFTLNATVSVRQTA